MSGATRYTITVGFTEEDVMRMVWCALGAPVALQGPCIVRIQRHESRAPDRMPRCDLDGVAVEQAMAEEGVWPVQGERPDAGPPDEEG